MFELFKTVLEQIKELYKHSQAKKQQVYEAIEAIERAANRTSIYITKSRNGTYKGNTELSEIWLDAAKAVRNLDYDLYQRLLMKAEYWANPEEWSNERVRNARISLLGIKRDSKKFRNKIKAKK